MRRTLLAGTVALVAFAVPAGEGSAGATPARTVVLRDIAFTPAVLRITRGQKVTWRWDDGPYVAHDVRSVGTLRFRGASRRSSGTHAVRLFRAGTYRYVCTLHPGMRGRIVVR